MAQDAMHKLKAHRETNEVRSVQHKTVSPKGLLK